LDIIGKDSPVIKSLNTGETWAVTPAATINITDKTPVIMEVENDNEDGETNYYYDGTELQTKSNEKVTVIPLNLMETRVTTKKSKVDQSTTEVYLKKRKLEVQIKNIELHNYKLQLEIFQLEKSLNI
jgi:hypothetical protein